MTLQPSWSLTESRLKENTEHVHGPKTCDDAADDELPPMEDIISPPLRKEISAEERTPQYSEEWTLNTNGSRRSLPQPKLADSVEASQGYSRQSGHPRGRRTTQSPGADSETPSGSTTEQAAPPRREAWWDVEDLRWVDDDQRPLPPIEQEGLVGSSHINPHGKDESVQGTSEDPTPCLQSVLSGVCGGRNELAPYSVPEPLDEDGDDDTSGLERDLLLAFEQQGKSVSAAAPSSLAHRCSTGPLQNQGDSYFQAEITHTRTEEPRDASRVRTLDEFEKKTLVAQQGAEGEGEEQQHEGEEDIVGLMEGREMQRHQQHGGGSELEGEEKELDELAMEECLHTREEDDEELDGLAMEECFHNGEEEDCPDNPEDGGYDCDSNDEEDEDIRPAKRRRLPSQLSDEGLEDRGQQSAKPDVTQPRRSLSTATERGHVQPKTVRTRARNSTADEQLYTLHPSPSPFASTESV